MDLATSVQKLITITLAFETFSAGSLRRRFPVRVASWFAIWAICLGIAACQTQNGSAAPPGSSDACLEKAREAVPAEASQRSADLQRDRYFVYRACMHAAGLRH